MPANQTMHKSHEYAVKKCYWYSREVCCIEDLPVNDGSDTKIHRWFYIEDLNAKYEKIIRLQQLIAPFAEVFGKHWDLSSGNWKNIDWQQLEKYAELLKQEKKLQELALLLGRYQSEVDKQHHEKVEQTIVQHQWTPSTTTKSEISGVHCSNDLSNVLPSELALMSDPHLEVVFAKNFVE